MTPEHTHDSSSSQKQSEGVPSPVLSTVEWRQLPYDSKQNYKQHKIKANDTVLKSRNVIIPNNPLVNEFISYVQEDDNFTPIPEVTGHQIVPNMMRIKIIPVSVDKTSSDPRIFLSENNVNDSIKINKAIRCAGRILYKREDSRMVCFFWTRYTNVTYVSFIVDSTRNTETGDQELKIDTYHVSDYGYIDVKKMTAIIECKIQGAPQEAVVLYYYQKMREDTKKKGRGEKNKPLDWWTVKLQALEMDTLNQRLLGNMEADHAVGVSVIQFIICLICDLLKWDLTTVCTCTEILKKVLNSELNAEYLPGPINTIRMLLTLFALQGCDAIKIASLMASSQDLPYQQITRFGRIQIMSDILRVGAFKLFYEIFAELSLFYERFIQHIRDVIGEQDCPQVKLFLQEVVLHLEKYSTLINPIKAIETRRNGRSKTVTITTPFKYHPWILSKESAKYLQNTSFNYGKPLHILDMLWKRNYQLLMEFLEQNNHTNVPSNWIRH